MSHTESSIQEFITQTLKDTAEHFGGVAKPIENDANLMAGGLIDSLGFVSLMSAIELRYDIEMEFDGSDPENFMTVNGLVSSTLKALETK